MQKNFNEKSMKSGIIMSAAFRIILHMLAPDKNFFNKCNFPVGNILFVPVESIVVSASLVVFFFFFFFFAKKDLETARIGSDRNTTQQSAADGDDDEEHEKSESS
jgi:phosphotransferase system  glucose/maltose/N-acetylglucosamine-specific IIC component